MTATLMSFPLQKQLGSTLHKSQQRIDQRVKKWQDLRQAVESVKVSKKSSQCCTAMKIPWEQVIMFFPVWKITRNYLSHVSCQHSAQTAQEENERIFTELLLSIERKYNDVKEMIRTHEKATVSRGEILLDRLEEEITLLRKRHNDLEKLSHTDDHIHFLHVRLILFKLQVFFRS